MTECMACPQSPPCLLPGAVPTPCCICPAQCLGLPQCPANVGDVLTKRLVGVISKCSFPDTNKQEAGTDESKLNIDSRLWNNHRTKGRVGGGLAVGAGHKRWGVVGSEALPNIS